MLEYPFDAAAVLQNKRALKKELLQKKDLLEKRVTLLSGTTIGEIKNILELFLLDAGIKPTFLVGDYGRWFEDVVFDDGALAAFKPDVVIFNTGVHNAELPAAGMDAAACDALLESNFSKFQTAWEACEALGCAVVANNFEYPRVRVMGNYEATAPSGKVRFVRRLNERMAQYAETHRNFYINDFNYLAGWYGLDAFSDPSYYNSYKYAQTPDAIPLLCHSYACIVKALFGKNKKALMMDLDNTLWSGVIGDDGVDGIVLGVESPQGIAHTELQKYAKELSGTGIILGVCSKNEDDIARSGFTHPSSVLRTDDFLSFKANWDPKPINLAASARELNIGTDAFVFADDNPAEREIVRQAGLGCAVPELGAPERYAETIANGGYFEVTSLSADDLKRADMYKQNAQREQAEHSFADYGAYLDSLGMRGYIGNFDAPRLERITQLANKTNQFNLTTRRYQPDEMQRRAESADCVTLYGRLEDRFGDNGLVTEIVGVVDGGALDIELWIMSCRVFKRGLEHAMFDALVRACRQRGIKTIRGHYLKTAKNGIVADFYGSLGFEKTAQRGDDSDWSYEIPDSYENKNKHIEVIYEQN
ncbi:MAG: HAD-IIIC family phosphatase [Oscillospiraceae bacterium]|nr:HAD-IIIC family phosphatase [Oscillospiraceae bacterium]